MAEQFHYNPPGSIFVFGSNLSGIHGAGAALVAFEEYGAEYGKGVGRQGQSYAIPTKSHGITRTLTIDEIRPYVADFLAHARGEPQTKFYVTKIGCGLAGHREENIKPLFKGAPENCLLPDGWRE